MLVRHCQVMDERAGIADVEIAADPFVFSFQLDCSKPMSGDHVTKRVAALKDHMGIATKWPETIKLEDEALRLFRLPPNPRPAGSRGPQPKRDMPFKQIGEKLGRSGHWAEKAVASASRREHDAPAESSRRKLALPDEFVDKPCGHAKHYCRLLSREGHFRLGSFAHRSQPPAPTNQLKSLNPRCVHTTADTQCGNHSTNRGTPTAISPDQSNVRGSPTTADRSAAGSPPTSRSCRESQYQSGATPIIAIRPSVARPRLAATTERVGHGRHVTAEG